ncbi:MAG: GntR family transcriptional regulator [Bryobacteraceae bacterium]
MPKMLLEEHANSPSPSSLADVAYLAIRDRVLRGQLRIGAALSRRQLAAEFGMSLLPVSEALQRLESDGLVESRPRAGTRVRVPTEQYIRDQYEVREALESQAARLFAQRATRTQRQELRRMGEQVDVLFNRLALEGEDPEFQYAVHGYHAQLHLYIAQCAACESLYRLIEKNQVLILNWLFDVAANRRSLPVKFHRDLVDCLIDGDPAAADSAIRHHVRFGLEDTVRNLRLAIAKEWRSRRRDAAPEDVPAESLQP